MLGRLTMEYIPLNWNYLDFLIGTYTVVDKYPEPGETPPELIVSEENIIYYGSSGFSRTPSTKDYILPAGTQVLALWPDTTEFYIATVMGRENVPVRLYFFDGKSIG